MWFLIYHGLMSLAEKVDHFDKYTCDIPLLERVKLYFSMPQIKYPFLVSRFAKDVVFEFFPMKFFGISVSGNLKGFFDNFLEHNLYFSNFFPAKDEYQFSSTFKEMLNDKLLKVLIESFPLYLFPNGMLVYYEGKNIYNNNYVENSFLFPLSSTIFTFLLPPEKRENKLFSSLIKEDIFYKKLYEKTKDIDVEKLSIYLFFMPTFSTIEYHIKSFLYNFYIATSQKEKAEKMLDKGIFISFDFIKKEEHE